MTHSLVFPQLGRTVVGRTDESVLDTARRIGIRIVGACGGRGTCGSCVVRLVSGSAWADADGGAERRAVSAGYGGRACRLWPVGDCTFDIGRRSLAPVMRTDVASIEDSFPVDDVLPADVAQSRGMAWLAREPARALGLAVDLGTTNVAGFLLDLPSGRRLASLAVENPQGAWGADVVTRLGHASRSRDAADEMRQGAVAAINSLAHDLCRAIGAEQAQVGRVAVCGNSAMQHLLVGGAMTAQVSAPFAVTDCDALDGLAADFGLDLGAGSRVYLPPRVGGFVGGDHVAALLATEDRWRSSAASVLIDIGTNSEISVIHDGAILSTSCPSGPALEGGHISCGMRAADGAIEHVKVHGDTFDITVIGKSEPVGICGSGVLDTLAALYESGAVNAGGYLRPDHPAVRTSNGRGFVTLAPGITFTQSDVRAVQLAKAAVGAALELLLVRAAVRVGDIEMLIIAGAFGAYIDLASAQAIGLLPTLPTGRVVQVGNAAGVGIQRMLVSSIDRERAQALANRCVHIELNGQRAFQPCFLAHIGFPSATRPRSTA